MNLEESQELNGTGPYLMHNMDQNFQLDNGVKTETKHKY